MSEGSGSQKASLGEVEAQPLSPPRPLQELGDALDFAQFSCGKLPLDDWLKRRAISADGRSARTYVACAGNRVVAYYCISAGSVDRNQWPGRFRRNAPDPIPVTVLGRLAVDREFQGLGLGADLLNHSLRQCLAAAMHIGVRALIVHPLDEEAQAFYAKFGFTTLPGDPHARFLPVEMIKRAFEEQG